MCVGETTTLERHIARGERAGEAGEICFTSRTSVQAGLPISKMTPKPLKVRARDARSGAAVKM